MGVKECALINRSKQRREVNLSAKPEQLGRIRKADPQLLGDVFSPRRCLVTNRNTAPGYRGSLEAGKMDCCQKVQNGHLVFYSDRCSRSSGHSLMSWVLCVFLAIVLILPACSASDPCYDIEEIADEWRDLSSPQGGKTDHCDENRFIPGRWYSFHLRGLPAWIPTQCIKSNMCGANVGMRVDLLGQSLPAEGENITAALCGAYDVLGKYDCCVLRTTVNIARCLDDRLVYSFTTPFDRCPVAVCTQGENTEVPPRALAKMGEDVNKLEDLSATDIPDTTPEVTDSTTAETTTLEEVVDDARSKLEESTESPAPPQPFMQQTTVAETTSDAVEELFTTAVTEETTTRLLSTDVPSDEDVGSEVTDSTTNDLPGVSDTTTESGASSTLVYEIKTMTSEETQETRELTTTDTLSETASTDIASQQDLAEETTADNHLDASSDANLPSSTDSTTSERPTTPAAEQQGVLDEELSSTSQPPAETDSKRSYDSDDEATTSTSNDFSDTTSSASSSSKMYEPASKSEEFDDTSSISTSTKTDTANTSTTESLLKTTLTTGEKTEWTNLRSSSSTPTEGNDVTTSKPLNDGDVIVDETMRFVFLGQPRNNAPVAVVQDLLGKFLRRAKDNEDWSYQLFSVSKAINYENRTTYMDFRIIRQGNDLKDGTTFFEQHQLKNFISENSNVTLIAQCRASKNCQEEAYYFSTPLASVFEQNAPAFTAVIVLCAICLLVLILVVLYSRFSKRGSWKAPEPEPEAKPENRRHFNGTQSPFTDAQIMKDEMVDNASASFNGSAKDGDTNLSGTWVIPLDQDTSNQNTVVSITTEDTKF